MTGDGVCPPITVSTVKADKRWLVVDDENDEKYSITKNKEGQLSVKKGDDASYESMKERVMERIEKVFRPEFLNRVDDVIVFRHLTIEDLKDVIEMELGKVRERLSERGLELELTDAAKAHLVDKGSNTEFGARPLRRAIENFVEDPLSEELLKGEFQGKDTITVDVKELGGKKQLVFEGSVTKAEPVPVGAGAGEGGKKS